jgi:diguanylate cyclase (GGDEF)-like protein/PAS domain S-box-containing protein
VSKTDHPAPGLRDHLTVVALYLALAMVSQSVFKTIAVWPAAGVAMAAVLVFGAGVWPGIALGTFLSVLSYQIMVGQSALSGSALTINLATVAGNTLAALLALAVCGRVTRMETNFVRVAWVTRRFFPALIVLGLCSGLPGVGVYWLLGQPWPGTFAAAVAAWSISNATGAIVIAPWLMSFWLDGVTWPSAAEVKQEAGPLLALVLLIWFIFGPGQAHIPSSLHQAALVSLPLLLMAVASRPAFTMLLLVLIFFAIWTGVSQGYGPFHGATGQENNSAMQTFVGSIAAIVLALQALAMEQRQSRSRWAENLQQANRELELHVSERTQALARANQDLAKREIILNQIIDSSTVAIFLIGADGVITLANQGMADMFRVPRASLVGREYVSLIHQTERNAGRQKMMSLLKGDIPSIELDRHYWRDDKTDFWGHLGCRTFFDTHDQKQGLLGIISDITKRHEGERLLRESRVFLQDVLDSVDNQMAVIGPMGVIVAVNKAWCAFSIDNSPEPGRATPRTGVGTNYLKVCQKSAYTLAEEASDAHDGIRAVLDGRLPRFSLEYPCHAPQEERWFVMTATPLAGGKKGAVVTHYNISTRKHAENQVRQLAYFDTLTHLPNRRMLNDRLGKALASNKRSNLWCAVMFLDLDNFKPLNDQHGHATGDLLLIEVARRLIACVREVDTVARLGGDEFVVMLHDLSLDRAIAQEQALAVATKVLNSLATPYVLSTSGPDGATVTVPHRCIASIGLALFDAQQTNPLEILKQADAAMYTAKSDGRNRIAIADRL